jgi:hypothetical protein
MVWFKKLIVQKKITIIISLTWLANLLPDANTMAF